MNSRVSGQCSYIIANKYIIIINNIKILTCYDWGVIHVEGYFEFKHFVKTPFV